MRVSLVTKTGKNFGAVLQAVALSYAIRELGAEVQIVQYPSKRLAESFRTIKRIHDIHDLYYDLRVLPKYHQVERMNQRFIEFRKGHLEFSQPYSDENAILEHPPEADLYMTGSDQVWNPNIRFSPIYFLEFGKSSTRRVSYSASIGLDHIPEQYIQRFRDYLSRFDMISVREESAEKVLNSIGIKATTTVDPTLLIDAQSWNRLIAPYEKKHPYILVYTLYDNKRLDDIALEAKKRLGHKIINIATDVKRKYIGDQTIWDAGPVEFLQLIANADLVITSSYHGMLFSINFGVPFVTIPPRETYSRFNDFLTSINIDDRMIESVSELTQTQFSPIERNQYLDQKIARSKEYLKNVLQVF